jgi:glycine cleavage system regulatory protein
MSFFDSEVVRAEMSEISELQEEIYKNVFNFFKMSNKDKIEHVNLLQKLLQKQQILYTRLSLSDDPEAKEMKERVMESATMMGLPKGTDINIIFKNMEALIDMMKGRIDAEGNP